MLATLRGFHRDGVGHIDFSESGELLVTAGMTGQHSIAVYDWAKRVCLFASAATEQTVLDVRFVRDEDFASCGVDHVHFWSRHGRTFRRQRGLLGKKTSKQPLLCVAGFGESVITGAISGNLLVWEGRNCVRAIKAHSGAVTALHVVSREGELGLGLASGSTDGKVQLWSSSLEVGATFDIASLGGISRIVHSLCWDVINSKILVATQAAEVYEISALEGYDLHDRPLVQGHYDRKLCGLAAHPSRPQEFATVGDDKTVRVWDAEKKSLVKMAVLDTMARCCHYSPDGSMIAVGLGGIDANGKRQRKDGAYVVLSEADLTIIHEARDSKQPISDVKFSPDGATLALSSHDRCIYLYNVGDFATTAKCRGHKGRIEHLDWSEDSKYLQSTDDAGELLFWEVESGEQRTARTMQNVVWQTQTCPFGWPCLSAWGQHDDGCVLSATCRSQSGVVLASADNYGRLQLWRYPASGDAPCSRKYAGHAAQIANLTFSSDDVRLLTTGGGDGVVMQWRHESEVGFEDEATRVTDEPTPEEKPDYVDGRDLERSAEHEAAATNDLAAVFRMEEEGRDEDFTPIQPWQRTIVAPSRAPPDDLRFAADTLKLEWVHGHRCHDARSNVKYTATGEIIFHTGTTVVVFNPREKKQRFYQQHRGDVWCLATHPSRSLAASGEIAATPFVYVWDYESLETVKMLHGIHRRAVSQLAFSPNNGKYLLTAGHDAYHSLVIYDWENGTPLVSSKTCVEKTLAVDFRRDGAGLVQCGVNFIRFWAFAGHNLTSSSAILGARGKLQPFLCLGWVGNFAVVGTFDGHLYRFLGRQLDVAVPAHAGAVNSISTTNEGICTGGKDGHVKVWSTGLDLRFSRDLFGLGSVKPCIRSVCWDNELARVLVGTLGAEIWELSAAEGMDNVYGDGPIAQGHYGGELWGLSVHPTLPQFCTVGDDLMLRIWSLFDHKLLRANELEMMSRACCYSPDGSQIAVGYGAPVRVSAKQFDGKFVVLSADEFRLDHEARDSQKWITEMKYSPNGAYLAVGSFDNRIYIYDAGDGYRLSSMIAQHNSYITHFDFSASSQYLMSNCGAHELCFFEADTGMHIPAASRLKDVKWGTQTSPLSWVTSGIWPPQADGTELTACDANLANAHGQFVIASGDNFGRLSLWRYPAVGENGLPKGQRYYGHSAHVTKVRWASGDSHLLSISAHDRAVFQWAHNGDDLAHADEAEAKPFSALDADGAGEADGAAGAGGAAAAADDAGPTRKAAADPADYVAAKPWLLSIVEPSDPPKPDVNAPEGLSLELECVHGFAGNGTNRSCLGYNVLGEVIFPAGANCVVYSKQTHSQAFYRAHGSEIAALAVSADGRFIASGENGHRPRVHVWQASTVTQVCLLPEFHRQGIAGLSFSRDGTRCCSVGADADSSIAVWRSADGEWFDGVMEAQAVGGDKPVNFCHFTEEAADAIGDDRGVYALCSGGVDHVHFWTLAGANLVPCRALWGAIGKVQTMLCGAPIGTMRFCTGASSGHLYVWKHRQCEKMIRAHERAIESCHATSAGLVTGGGDGFVKLWTLQFQHLRSYDLSEAPVPPLSSAVCAVYSALDPTGMNVTKICVGTKSSEVYEVAKDSGSITLLAEGHHGAETWALAPHPTDDDVFASAGDDATVRVWSIGQRRLLRKAKLDTPVRALAWAPDGKRLLVGMGGHPSGLRQKKDGAFLLLNAETMQVLFEGRDSRHYIRDAKYSPDGKSFALASMDHKIYLYDAGSTVLRAKCDKHNSHVMAIDFSDDSAYVQSDAGDYEHLYHNAMDGTNFRLPSQLKNVNWATWTCVFGWAVQGAWPTYSAEAAAKAGAKGLPDVTTTDRSADGKLLAAGDEAGELRVYKYPCLAKEQESVTEGAHVSHVARARFNKTGTHLVTVGKRDRAIMVWRVVQAPPPEDKHADKKAGATKTGDKK